jgi:hypothetical protein
LRRALGLWTASATGDPSARDFDERVVRERWCAARTGMRVCARRPGPDHERRLDVGYPLIRSHGAARGVCECTTEFGNTQSFPRHPLRREVPVGRARYSARDLVCGLMAGAAMKAGCATPIRTARHVRHVPVAIIALPRKISVGVAVHAARVLQNGCHLFEQCGGLHHRALR